MQPTPKARFEQFSDGVFAIAITILALELHVPKLTSMSVSGSLHELIPLIPTIVTFIISFVTIAIFWVNHHQLTREIVHIAMRRILWGNMLFLLFVTLIPFATEIVSTNPLHPLAMATYALVLFGGSVSFSIARYMVHKGLGEHHIPMKRSIVGPITYIIAAAVAFTSVWASFVLLIIPPIYYFLPKPSSPESSEETL